MSRRISTAPLTAYSLTAIPLAMAALPIYLHVPKFYATTLGVNLAAIGFLLLAARALDALQDPLLGYWSDCAAARHSKGRLIFIALATPLLAFGMVGLFMPPALAPDLMPWWLMAMLLLVYVAFSAIQISYQAYGAEISADPGERTRITAWREGLGLIGVFLAAALPQYLSDTHGARAGFGYFSLLFVPLLLLCVAITFWYSPPAITRHVASGESAFAAMLKPLKNSRFKALLVIFILNGIAAASPATLVLFFIEDVIRAPQLTAQFLIAYFAAGALGMPLWVWLSGRFGKPRAWLIGMIVSIAAFVWAFLLGAGDTTAFMVICVLSGLGLGADLALPPSILADVIDDDSARGLARNEGAYFGLWNLVTKMNLALAAGVALPALAILGYQPGVTTSVEATRNLVLIYALLPCALKAIAALLLFRSTFFISPTLKATS